MLNCGNNQKVELHENVDMPLIHKVLCESLWILWSVSFQLHRVLPPEISMNQKVQTIKSHLPRLPETILWPSKNSTINFLAELYIIAIYNTLSRTIYTSIWGRKKDTHNYPTCHVSRHHLLADSFPQASGHSRTSIPPFKAASTGPPKAFPVNVRARIAKITTVLGWTCWASKKCERNLRDFTVDKELDTENYGLEQVLPDGKLRCPCPISGQYPGRLGRSQDNLRSLVASVASHRIPAELRLISVQYEMKKWSTALWNWTWKKWPLASMNQSRLNAGLD